MRRLIDNIGRRLVRRSAVPPDAAEAADPAAGLVYVLTDPALEAMPRTLVNLLGEPPDNAHEIIASVAQACRQRGEYPVAVMSELRPEIVSASAFPVEFIPTFGHLPLGADAYESYARRRWSLMLAKWNFARQIELTVSFDDFLGGQLARAADADQARPSAS